MNLQVMQGALKTLGCSAWADYLAGELCRKDADLCGVCAAFPKSMQGKLSRPLMRFSLLMVGYTFSSPLQWVKVLPALRPRHFESERKSGAWLWCLAGSQTTAATTTATVTRCPCVFSHHVWGALDLIGTYRSIHIYIYTCMSACVYIGIMKRLCRYYVSCEKTEHRCGFRPSGF